MPADFIYWNPVDFDSDESIFNTYPRNYIDPWDLENYVYMREHVDSREIVSESNSLEDTVEVSSSSYYAPLTTKGGYSPLHDHNNGFDSLLDSEYGGTAKYAEIEYVYGDIQSRNNNTALMNEARRQENVRNYGVQSMGLESYDAHENIHKDTNSPPAVIYDANHQNSHHHNHHHHHKMENSDKRRMSYSYGDYEYNHYSPQSLYTRLESRKSESDRPSPIYDDIRNSRFSKPENFGLSTYGHLQIDYSCSWNNLDKYIYN